MTPETKALIEQEAEKAYPDHYTEFWEGQKKRAYIAGATPYAEKWEAAEKENKRLRDCLEKIASSEGECCQRCEGDGKLWADGKAHYPSYEGPTINCGHCGGDGRVYIDAQLVATEALKHNNP